MIFLCSVALNLGLLLIHKNVLGNNYTVLYNQRKAKHLLNICHSHIKLLTECGKRNA